MKPRNGRITFQYEVIGSLLVVALAGPYGSTSTVRDGLDIFKHNYIMQCRE